MYWFLFDPAAQRDVRRLRPTIDVVPPLIVGFVLSLTMVFSESYSYLYGIWMCMFGLANLAGRHILPRAISFVGMFYVTCGALLLLAFPVSFLNPWPMGLVFFAGEWAAGVVLHFDAEPRPAFRSFFHVKENYHAEAK